MRGKMTENIMMGYLIETGTETVNKITTSQMIEILGE